MRNWFLVFAFIFSTSLFCQNQISFGEMKLPVRMTRTIGVSGSAGWNGLVGFGATLQYYISPHFGLDGGAGLASTGFKFAGRLRYLFLEKNFTPLIGAGYIYSTGFPGQVLELEDATTGEMLIIEVLPSSFIQVVGGVEVVINKGFFAMATMGYAIQINNNLNYISGTPSADTERIMQIVYGPGIVMEFSVGYIFGNKGKFRGKL